MKDLYLLGFVLTVSLVLTFFNERRIAKAYQTVTLKRVDKSATHR